MPNITENALVKRINRQLSSYGQRVRRCAHNSPWFSELGRIYVCEGNRVTAKHFDLEFNARELGVMKDSEVLTEA